MKIAIAGIGGVGGYFGGLLARHFLSSRQVQVYFIARGDNGRAIQKNGLRLQTGEEEQLIYPTLTELHADKTGKADLLICCTKSYDLEKSIEQLAPCISNETVILPLLNGVDSAGKIKNRYPENEVWDGCVYLVSRLVEPGLVKQTGNIARLYFGSPVGTEQKLNWALSIFSQAGIQATLSNNINETVWEKFLFISPLATLTSYLDIPIRAVLNDPSHKKLLNDLLSEIKAVADAKKILLPEGIIQKTLDKMSAMPYDTISSMHSDFQKGKETELESLTGYVVKEAQSLNIATPTYIRLYEELANERMC